MKMYNICKVEGFEYQVLYIVDDNEICSLFFGYFYLVYEQVFQGDESVCIDVMDVYVKVGCVYWINWYMGIIFYCSLLFVVFFIIFNCYW